MRITTLSAILKVRVGNVHVMTTGQTELDPERLKFISEQVKIPHHNANPHHLLGYGGKEDVLTIGRRAVRDAVLERIDLLGCCGKT